MSDASISRPRLRRHLIGLESQLMGLIRCSCGVWGRVTPIIFRTMRIINVACQRKMRTAHIDFGSVMAALPWLLLMLLILSYGLPLGDSEGLRANRGAANNGVSRAVLQRRNSRRCSLRSGEGYWAGWGEDGRGGGACVNRKLNA